MIATGSDGLIFYDSMNNAKYKSSDIKVDKLTWSYSSNCFLVILSNSKLYIWNSIYENDCTAIEMVYEVIDFELTKDDAYILFTSNDMNMRVYDIKRKKISAKEYPFNVNANRICLSADDVMIAVNNDNCVEVLNRTSKEYKKLECENCVVKMQWSWHPSEIFKLYIMTYDKIYLYDCLKQIFSEIYSDNNLIDFSLSNNMRVMYVSGSSLVKYDCKSMAVMSTSDQQYDANCLYFDDNACLLYIGYQHGIIKLSADLQVIESIALGNSAYIAMKSKITQSFEIPINTKELFTPPRQVTDSVQNMQDIPNNYQFGTPPTIKNTNNPLDALEERLKLINQNASDNPVGVNAMDSDSISEQIIQLRQELKNDLVNIHVDMIKQMHQQKVISNVNLERCQRYAAKYGSG